MLPTERKCVKCVTCAAVTTVVRIEQVSFSVAAVSFILRAGIGGGGGLRGRIQDANRVPPKTAETTQILTRVLKVCGVVILSTVVRIWLVLSRNNLLASSGVTPATNGQKVRVSSV